MRLSELAGNKSFALLSPGFTGGNFILCEKLHASGTDGNIVVQPFEGAAQWYKGNAREVDLEIDIPAKKINYLLDENHYIEKVRYIKNTIASGDVYQVNLTTRATISDVSGEELFALFCKKTIPGFAAWVKLPGGNEFVSASPEMFFKKSSDSLFCQPMKGTAPKENEQQLLNSEKDKAELAMITDIIRNDMTPLCEPRSVKVIHERKLLSLPYAVQAVSEVKGTLLSGSTISKILKALHPCGSVTGAPKKSAVALIKQLEDTPRSYYCGALGFIRGNDAIFSVLIRSAYRCGRNWIYGTGGGIVWDSDPVIELEEARIKMGSLR